MKYAKYIFLLFVPVLLSAQTQSYKWVKTDTMKSRTGTGKLVLTDSGAYVVYPGGAKRNLDSVGSGGGVGTITTGLNMGSTGYQPFKDTSANKIRQRTLYNDQPHNLGFTSGADSTRIRAIDKVVDIREFGVTGDGSTNDSSFIKAAIDSAAARGHELVIRPLSNGNKTYATGQLTISSKVDIRFEDGAILKQRNALSTAAAATIVYFASGSAGSVIDGAIIDGNRAVVKPAHIAAASTVSWSGILIADSNITIRNTTVQNVTTEAILASGVASPTKKGCVIENVIVKNSGAGIILYGTPRVRLSDIYISGLDNDSVKIYQHGVDISTSDDFVIDNLVMENCGGDTLGLSTWYSGMTIIQSDGIINNLRLETPTVYGINPLGISIMSSKISASNWKLIGYISPAIEVSSMREFVINGLVLDGQRRGDGGGNGITITQYGRYYAPSSSTGYSTKDYSRGVLISNALVKGFSTGVVIGSDNVNITNSVIEGNQWDGIYMREFGANNSFPANNRDTSFNNVFLNNVVSQYNGRSGLLIKKGDGVYVNGGSYSNNGQDTTQAAVTRSGIRDTSAGNVGKIYLAGGVVLENSTPDTLTGGASLDYGRFSGAFSAGDTINVSISFPSKFHNNQIVWIGDSINARILNLVGDSADVITLNALTIPSKLTAGTGTISSSGVTLTGVGTALSTEIDGRYWIKASGQYRRIVSSTSATAAATETAFSPALSGASFEIIKLDIRSVPTQQYGARLTNADVVYMPDVITNDNLTSDLSVTNQFNVVAPALTTFTDSVKSLSKKTIRWGVSHYTKTEEPLGILYAQSTLNNGVLHWGGGTSLLNAPTEQRWFIGANYVTTTGTQKMTLSNTGLGLNSTTPAHLLTLTGTGTTAALNITNTSVNTTTSTAAQAVDTSSVNVTFTGSGKPELRMTGPLGDNYFQVDSTKTATAPVVSISGTSGNTLVVETSGLVYDATNNRVGIGTASPVGDLDILRSWNGNTQFQIKNTTAGASAQAAIQVTADVGYFGLYKYSSSRTTYKILGVSDGILYNSSSAGDISILNDYASGDINFAAGGSSTNHLTISSTGNVGIGDASPASMLTVGSGDLFQVNSSGNIVKINNVTTSFPASQGAASSVLTNNGSGTLTWASATASPPSPSVSYEETEEWINANGVGKMGWTTGSTGTGSSVAAQQTSIATGDTNRWGIINMTAGTTTTGYSVTHLGQNAVRLTGGETIFEASIKTPAIVAATSDYYMRIGFHDAITQTTVGDGVYFEWHADSASQGWRGAAANNSAGTTNKSYTSASTAITASTWYRLRCVINATGTSATFYIDGTQLGSAITTNIPTATGTNRQCGPNILIGSYGTAAAKTMSVDYFYMKKTFSPSR